MLTTNAQCDCLPQDVGNSYPYFGMVVKGGGKRGPWKGWEVCFDILPHDRNVVENIM